MKKIPTSVKDYLSNANYYLEATSLVPFHTFDAIRILLLLTAWENIQIAEEELHSWAQQTPPAKELYKSHAYKFRDVRESKSIDKINVSPKGKPQITKYSSGADFEKLLYICRYGHRGAPKELSAIFKSGWFSDDFQRYLVSKIKWEETAIKMFEDLLKSEEI